MAVNASAAYATYSNGADLDRVLQALGDGGFEKENVFMLLSRTHPVAVSMRESSKSGIERAANMATAKLIGWLSGFGAVVIPTFGFFIRSREFFRALVVERECFSGRGQSKILGCLGLSVEDAGRFEERVYEAGVFVYVACDESAKTQCALEVLQATGAEESGLLRRAVAAGAAA